MASPTPNLALTYPAHGGAVNAWDTPLNADFDALDAAMAGTQTFAGGTVAFGNSVVLTQTQANNRRVIISGVLTHDFAITFPAIGGLWVIDNQTTGAFNVTAITAGSAATPIVCSQSLRTLIGSNGTDMSLADSAAMHVIPFSGNPNGFVAGTASSAQNPPSAVWDYTGQTLYVCTTTGNAAGAVWSTPNQPSAHGFDTATNLGLVVSSVGNLLNVALKTAAGADPTPASPVSVNFQALTGTNTNGLPTTVNITAALSIATVAGGTGCNLGATNNTPFRFWIALFNDGGTPRLALRNCSNSNTIFPVSEYGIATTVAMTNASNAAGTWYTPAGIVVTNKAFRLLGYCEYVTGFATVQTGVYSVAPDNVVLFGPGVKKPGDTVQVLSSVISGATTPPGIAFTQTQVNLGVTLTSTINLIKACVAGTVTVNTGITASTQLSRGAGPTLIGNLAIAFNNSGATLTFPVTVSALDKPSASTTYYVYLKCSAGNGATFNPASNSGTSYIEVSEIMG